MSYFGGFQVNVANSIPTPAQYQTSEIQSAMGGTDDTILLGLHRSGCCDYHMVAYNDDGGVAHMDTLGPGTGDTSSVERLCVGAYSIDGYTNVYTNDYAFADADGDGLGAYLEYYLGTCNTASWPDPYTLGHDYCNSAVIGSANVPQRLKDTDADGMSDYEELFGIDVAPTQKLPAWGASPTHKDMFFEVDQHCVSTSVPFPPWWLCRDSPPVADQPMISEAMLARFQFPYAAGPKEDVLNRDGMDGVAVHFDIGPSGASCFNKTLCGNWGGGGDLVPGGNSPPSYGISMNAVRKQIFRKFLLTVDDCHPDEDGVHCLSDPKKPAHEMGHTLWLQHHGRDEWGGVGGTSKLTCKPHFRSIMAYSSDPDPDAIFSKGQNIGLYLDPARTGERAALTVSASYLAEGSGASLLNFPIASGVWPYDVDFNRDRMIDDDSAWIRAGLAIGGNEGAQCYGSEVGYSKVQSSSATIPLADVTPDIAGFDVAGAGSRIFLFWVAPVGSAGSTNVIFYRSDTRSGPNHKGSCSGGEGRLTDTNCNTWSSPVNPWRGPDDGTQNVTGVAATEWNNQMHVAYRTEDASGAGVVKVAVTSTFDGAGQLATPPGSWSTATLPVPSGGGTAPGSQVEISPMYVSATNPDFEGVRRVLAVFVLGTDGHHKWSFQKTDGTWSSFRDVKVGGVSVDGAAVAGVAVWPNRKQNDPTWPDYSDPANCDPADIDACTACGVFTKPAAPPGEPNQRVRFLCYKKSTDDWIDLTTKFPSTAPINLGKSRPGIAYHTFRAAPASPQAGGDTYVPPLRGDPRMGQFWMTVLNKSTFGGWAVGQLYVTDRIDVGSVSSPAHPVTGISIRPADFLYNTDALSNSGGGPLYEDGWLSALKGARSSLTGVNGDDRYPELWFFPFVDGTYRAPELTDGNEYQVIESAVCKSLWPSTVQATWCAAHSLPSNCKCGANNPFGW